MTDLVLAYFVDDPWTYRSEERFDLAVSLVHAFHTYSRSGDFCRAKAIILVSWGDDPADVVMRLRRHLEGFRLRGFNGKMAIALFMENNVVSVEVKREFCREAATIERPTFDQILDFAHRRS